jgi:branched-chain amino acid transport system ATP-binding protein
LRRDTKRVEALLDSVYRLFPVLKDYRRRQSSFLCGGEQQMVSIGRMLMSAPEVLLLDEPSVALSPVAVEAVSKALMELRRGGASLLLIEQRIDVAVRVCDRLYIMMQGEIVEELNPKKRASMESASSANILAKAAANRRSAPLRARRAKG